MWETPVLGILSILTGVFCFVLLLHFIVILAGVKWCHCDLRTFMCLLAIWIYFLNKCVSQPFDHFLFGLSFCWWVISFLDNLDKRSTSGMWLTNIPLPRLFNPFMPFNEQSFKNFNEVQFTCFYCALHLKILILVFVIIKYQFCYKNNLFFFPYLFRSFPSTMTTALSSSGFTHLW